MLKITNFYFACKAESSEDCLGGQSFAYRAPELLLGGKSSFAEDLWAAGCVFGEMISKRPLFSGRSEIEQLILVFKCFGTPSEHTWPGVSLLPHFNRHFPKFEAIELSDKFFVGGESTIEGDALQLMLHMFVCDPSKRFSAKSCLENQYFYPLRKDLFMSFDI